MNVNRKIFYIILPAIFAVSLYSCDKKGNCPDNAEEAIPPMTAATFRVLDSNGRDLLASATPGHLSFDSLTVHQPCRQDQLLKKNIEKTGEGGLESYVISFNTRQPNTGENVECFNVTLDWGNGNTDLLEFDGKTEHHTCGITYHLEGVRFNGQKAGMQDGHYILRK